MFMQCLYKEDIQRCTRSKQIGAFLLIKLIAREGDSFEVLCKSRAYPQEVGYRWFFNGAELEGMVNNSLLIEEISRMYDQADISCLVDKFIAKFWSSTKMEVNCRI